MELNIPKIIVKMSHLTTVSSYIKGTLIFTWFTITDHINDSVSIGLIFVLLAILVNGIVGITTLIAIFFVKNKVIKQQLIRALGFQLANIPIAISYYIFVMNDNSFG